MINACLQLHNDVSIFFSQDVANTIFEDETDMATADCASPTAKGLATR